MNSLIYIIVSAWSFELTNQSSANNSDLDGNFSIDCPANYANGKHTPNRGSGGWFEHRFLNAADPAFFQSLNSFDGTLNDATRACPMTFNEFTMNHWHGSLNAKVASYKGVIYAVYDSVGGYYGANKIKLQRDPSSALANGYRPYTVWEIARNPWKYIDVNPGSPFYWQFENDGVPGYSPLNDGCEKFTSTSTYKGVQIDRNWFAHVGIDHEKTYCRPPGMIQTFDPDININPNGGYTVVAWSERYVDGFARIPSQATGATGLTGALIGSTGVTGYEYGFDDTHPVPKSPVPDWFPWRPLTVYANAYWADDFPTSRTQDGGPPAEQPIAPSGLNTGPYPIQAMAPRVAIQTDANSTTVAWVETTFSKQTNEYKEEVFAPALNSTPILRAKRYNSGTGVWSSLPTSDAKVGELCELQSTSSGRATGRKRTWGGMHAITTMVYEGKQVPIVVLVERVSGNCKLRVKRYIGNAWQTLGAEDLRIAYSYPQPTGTFWPNITVSENIPYITWVEDKIVQVKRWNATTSVWESMGGAWNVQTDYNESARAARSPSIAVVPNTPATTADDGATIYVALSENEPGDLYNVNGANDGREGAWGVTVKRCQTYKTAGGWACGNSSLHTTRRARIQQGTGLPPLYSNQPYLGITWGRPLVDSLTSFLGVLPPQTYTYGPELKYASTGATGSVQTGEVLPGAGGAVDLIHTNTNAAGQPSFALSWLGPVQNHRGYDMGVYAKEDTPFEAEAQQIALGAYHSVAVVPGASSVLTWGLNDDGQLGDGTTNPSNGAIRTIPIGEPVIKVAAGNESSAALTASGKIFTWGNNANLTLCNGSASPAYKTTPGLVTGSNVFVDMAMGYGHIIALTAAGAVLGCGQDNYGQLGDNNSGSGVEFSTWRPVKMNSAGTTNLTSVIQVYAGATHSCAIRDDRKVYCWGRNNSGQLGRNLSTTTYPLVAYAGLINGTTNMARSLALGYSHSTMIAFNSNEVWGWGSNAERQVVPTSATANFISPTLMRSSADLPAGINRLSAGAYATYYTTNGEAAFSAGFDSDGERGDGAAANPNAWSQVVGTKHMTIQASAVGRHVYSLKYNADSRSVLYNWYCWGRNNKRQCEVSNATLDQPILTH